MTPDPAVIDDLDRHMRAAGAIERAAVVPGTFLAWCVNLQLVSEDFLQAHERSVLRVRYREITGAELLVGCGGSLRREALTEQGRRFCDHYYESYLDDWREAFGDDVYAVEDGWATYERIAPTLTRRYMDWQTSGQKAGAKKASGGRWWKRWI